MQGVIQIIGNSDQLERSLAWAAQLAAAIEAGPYTRQLFSST
jgi:hypothetical protein